MANFCSECGKKFEESEVKFCPNCGVSQGSRNETAPLRRIPEFEGWREVVGKPEYTTNQQKHYDRTIAVLYKTKALEQYKNNSTLSTDSDLLSAAISVALDSYMPYVEKHGMDYETAKIAITDYLNYFVLNSGLN